MYTIMSVTYTLQRMSRAAVKKKKKKKGTGGGLGEASIYLATISPFPLYWRLDLHVLVIKPNTSRYVWNDVFNFIHRKSCSIHCGGKGGRKRKRKKKRKVVEKKKKQKTTKLPDFPWYKTFINRDIKHLSTVIYHPWQKTFINPWFKTIINRDIKHL